MTLLRRLRPGVGSGDATSQAWLVVGLGNPGTQYAPTRHNVGYRVADLLVARLGGGSYRPHKGRRADVLEGRLTQVGSRVVVARPRSYMNESGGPVRALLDYYRVPLDRLVVVHDEMDLPLGSLRIKQGGGDNGHNGIRSVRTHLGSGEFVRVRLGVGRPPGPVPAADWVLRPFASTERPGVEEQVERAADAVESLIRDGLALTQTTYN